MGRNIGRNIGGDNLAGGNLGAMVERILDGWNVGRKDDWIEGRWEGIQEGTLEGRLWQEGIWEQW